jgi:hypothetical protein
MASAALWVELPSSPLLDKLLGRKPEASKDIAVADACLRVLSLFSCRLRREPVSFRDIAEEAVEMEERFTTLLLAVPGLELVPVLICMYTIYEKNTVRHRSSYMVTNDCSTMQVRVP